MEKVIELKWASDHEEANNATLALTRSFMPVDIKALGDEEIVRRAPAPVSSTHGHSISSTQQEDAPLGRNASGGYQDNKFLAGCRAQRVSQYSRVRRFSFCS